MKNCEKCEYFYTCDNTGYFEKCNGFYEKCKERCKDCFYLVEGDNGDWICDNCQKRIDEVPDGECFEEHEDDED